MAQESPSASGSILIPFDVRPGFVGRREILERVPPLLNQAMEGKGQSLWIQGEAGVGKTDLLDQLQTYFHTQGLVPYRISGVPELYKWNLGPFLSLLETVCQFDQRDDHRALAAKMNVLRGYGLQKMDIRSLWQLLPWSQGYASKMKIRDETAIATLESAILKLLVGLAKKNPVAYIFDHPMYMDAMSKRVIARLPLNLSDQKAILIIGLRPGDLSVPEDSATNEITLRPMDPRALLATVANRLGSTRFSDGIKRRILAESGGNPQLALLLLDYLEEQGMLFERNGSWGLLEVANTMPWPSSSEDVNSTRFSSLSEPLQELVSWIALLGEEATPGALGVLYSRPEKFDEDLQFLKDMRWIRVMTEGKRKIVHLFYEIQREMIWKKAGTKALLNLHNRVVGFLSLQSSKPAYIAGVALLHHEVWVAVDSPSRIRKLESQGDRLADQLQFTVAAEFYEQAANCLTPFRKKSPDKIIYDYKVLYLMRKSARCRRVMGQHERAVELLKKSVTFAVDHLEARHAAVETLLELADLEMESQRWKEAQEYLEQAQKEAARSKDPKLVSFVNHRFGRYYSAIGEKNRAHQKFTEALTIARNAEDRLDRLMRWSSPIYLDEADLLLSQGQEDAAHSLLKRLSKQSSKDQDATHLLPALSRMASLYFGRGDLKNAIKYAQLGLANSDLTGDRHSKAVFSHFLARFSWRQKHKKEATNFVRQSYRISREINWPRGMQQARSLLEEIVRGSE